MPHAALWVVQLHQIFADEPTTRSVSMPHAALWVVQQGLPLIDIMRKHSFNAARGFVGGAAASLAALVPLGGKSPFGKSPEI